MFLQLGVTLAEATFFSALLFVPWVLKSFLRSWVERFEHARWLLHGLEALFVTSLLFLAFSIGTRNAVGITSKWFVLFASMIVGFLCVLHELTALTCCERMMHPLYRRFLAPAKQMSSQMSAIVTYGAFIFLVGALQVLTRNVRESWQTGCYLAAGILLFFALMHLVLLASLRNPSFEEWRKSSEESRPVRGDVWRGACLLFLLLLPQALMYHARVLYLYDVHTNGGLQCTIQEIGFAQGTVGIITFSLGLFLGKKFISFKGDLERTPLFWLMALCLVLSPFVYVFMTILPPQDLWHLSICTGVSQLLFGYGLSACRLPLAYISGVRYRSTLNLLRVSPFAAAMLLPMAVSGWLVVQMGYTFFFIFSAVCALFSLLGVFLLRHE